MMPVAEHNALAGNAIDIAGRVNCGSMRVTMDQASNPVPAKCVGNGILGDIHHFIADRLRVQLALRARLCGESAPFWQ